MLTTLSISIVLSCGSAGVAGPEPKVFEVAGKVRHAVSERNRIYVAAGSAGLQVIDVALGKAVLERRFPDQDVTWVAIDDGRGFVLATGKERLWLHEVRLKDASLVRSIDLGREPARRVEVAAPDLVVVVGNALRLVDLETGAIVSRVVEEEGVVVGSDADGGRVAVTRVYPGGLWIFDRARPGSPAFRELARWPRQVRLLGSLAFLKDGAGVWRLDLESGRETALDLHVDDMVKGDDARLWARSGRTLHRVDPASLRNEAVRELPEELEEGELELLEVRGGRALLKSGSAVVLLDLPVSEPGAGR